VRPTTERRRSATRALGARTALALACLSALFLAPPLHANAASGDGDGRLAIHFLAVGQGDGALVRTPHGRWIMVDAGPRTPGMDAGRRVMLPFLRRHGVRRLAIVVASHGHADHVGGMPAVLAAVPADVVLEPGQPLGIPAYLEFLAELEREGRHWHAARAGERLELDGVVLRVWHPDSAWMARGEEDPNANSVVLTVEYGRFRAVLAGDAGLPMEALHAREIGDVTLLKVGHHGSAGATGDAWLEALRPEVCVVSVGPNTYGHPSPAALQRMDDAGCGVWRTDRDGSVTVTTDGRTALVEAGKRRAMLTLSGEGP
jgi:competence protein ComEC